MGPACYGRSDCATPLQDSKDDNVTEEITTESRFPKRYIILNDFKSPVFGAYKYDPLKGDFVMPNKTTTQFVGGARDIVMRAASDEPIIEEPQNQTTTQPDSEILITNTTQSKNESENAVSQSLPT